MPPAAPRMRDARVRVVALAAAALAAAGCDDAADAPRIEAATPPYGPLVGGTRITLTGAGFASGGAAPNRVLVGGREAPLVATVDDATLELVIPAGEQPGDAEVVVLNDGGNARATGVFRYSTPPAITGVAPERVLYTSDSTQVTVTGTGFLAEGAGDVILVVDGQLVTDVEVQSDTSLTFTAPPGRPLLQPDLELVSGRGRALRPRAFRYDPSLRGGLLLFPTGGAFAVFFDPVDLTSVPIPWIVSPAVRFTAVTRDEHGDYWGIDRSRRFGRLDLKTQRIEVPIQAQGWYPTMIRVGREHFAIERGALQFGRFDPASASFTAIGDAAIPCCGSYGLASDGTTTYVVAREGVSLVINTIDLVTGVAGTPIPIAAPAGFHIEEMRFFRGTLYASTRNGQLATIDPVTGVASILPVSLGRFCAMEVFE